jgi:hypothetical protein
VPGGCDILLVRAIRFLTIIIIVIADRDCNPLRVPLSPLLVVVGILLGVLDGDARWRRLAATGDRFPTAWDRERPDRLFIGGMRGGNVEKLPSGVLDGVVLCPVTRWLLCVAHVAPGCL